MADFPQQDQERMGLVTRVEAWVRRELEAGKACAHGWLHTDRVRRTALILACAEGVDSVLAEMAALLHDMGRTVPGPENEHGARSAEMAAPVLASSSLTAGEADEVLHAIRWHNSGKTDTQLLRILRDADMLDGLGAMGIVRALMSKSHLLPYDPGAPFAEGTDRWPARYCSDQIEGQMDWFNRLSTTTARNMAQDRVAFMEQFMAQARSEIGATDGPHPHQRGTAVGRAEGPTELEM
jgi:uncharacterized protein